MAIPRHKTKYPGVFYRDAERLGGSGTERVYYVVYKKDGKTQEEKAGRQYADGMTEARANAYRAELIEGKREPRKEKKARQEAEKQAAATRPTIRHLWADYKALRPASRALGIDEGRFNNFLASTFGDKTPDEIATAEVDKVRVQMLNAGKSPQTTKHALALLKRIILSGVRTGRIDPPSPKKLQITLPAVSNEKTETLTDAQFDALLVAAEQSDNWKAGALVLLALSTGMRRGEMLKLRWEQVNFEQKFIALPATQVKARENQIVALTDFATELLMRLPRTSSYVFPGETGEKPITNLYPALRRIRKAAGLPKDMRPLHAWRHVFASRLASNRETLYVIQRLLRHADSRMTERYAHLADEAVRRAAGKVDEDLRSAQGRGKERSAASSPEESKPE